MSKYPSANELPILEPLNVSLEDFPRDEDVPDGCVVLDNLKDDEAFKLDYQEFIYCVRKTSSGKDYPLKLYVLIPRAAGSVSSNAIDKAFPTVVYCQGSAWHKQKLYSRFTDHVDLARKGFVVVGVEYRPSEVAPFPAQAQDLWEAVQFVCDHAAEFSIDTNKIGLWGNSSGAHTALMVAYASSKELLITDSSLDAQEEASEYAQEKTQEYEQKNAWKSTQISTPEYAPIKCVVDWYGPTDFTLMRHYPSSTPHDGADTPEGYEIGHLPISQNIEKAQAANPINYISGNRTLPPTLIMHGGRDELVAFNQSCRLYERLRECNQDVELYKLNDANHGKNGFSDPQVLAIVEEFLRKHLG